MKKLTSNDWQDLVISKHLPKAHLLAATLSMQAQVGAQASGSDRTAAFSQASDRIHQPIPDKNGLGKNDLCKEDLSVQLL